MTTLERPKQCNAIDGFREFAGLLRQRREARDNFPTVAETTPPEAPRQKPLTDEEIQNIDQYQAVRDHLDTFILNRF
jgi:hypothetical protein